MTNETNNIIEKRLKSLEVTKEDLEQEIKTTDILIQKLERVNDEISPTIEITQEVKRFINKLKNENTFKEVTKDEIEESIEFVKHSIDTDTGGLK